MYISLVEVFESVFSGFYELLLKLLFELDEESIVLAYFSKGEQLVIVVNESIEDVFIELEEIIFC